MQYGRIYRIIVLVIELLLLAAAAIPLTLLLGIAGLIWKLMNWLLERGNVQ